MYLIAEIGFNHAGDMAVAQEMIRQAAAAGADAVKFQTYRAEDLALPSSPHFAAIQCGEMDLEQHRQLKAAADAAGIAFISTPFSIQAVELLEDIGVGAYKVASMDCTNRHLLGRIAMTGKPVYLSTGMATLQEIAESLEFLDQAGAGQVALLHCIAHYPAGSGELNLDCIPMLGQVFGRTVGYSDHHPGIEACFAAAILGAEVVETHFTLDPATEGGDHFHSCSPQDIATLRARLQAFEEMRGSASKVFLRPDRDMAPVFRRGLHAARDLPAGHALQLEDLLLCRPAGPLSPSDLPQVLGRPLARELAQHAPLTPDHLEPED